VFWASPKHEYAQEQFMKRKGLLLLVLATLVAGGTFAQKVGDTVDVMGQKYDVKEAKDGRLVLQLAATLDGNWQNPEGWLAFTISGNSSIITKLPASSGYTKNAIDKGFVKLGSTPYFRNISKTGDRKWSAQVLQISSRNDVATGISYSNRILTLSADGKTFTEDNGFAWVRQ
jgi:hypothetical protein